MTESIRADIRAFVIENFLFGDTSHGLDDDASLIGNDIVDSTGVLELVFFLEQRFGISVADTEMLPANLDTVSAIARFVAGKPAAAVA